MSTRRDGPTTVTRHRSVPPGELISIPRNPVIDRRHRSAHIDRPHIDQHSIPATAGRPLAFLLTVR
jgi:hypothetical protein